MEFKKLLKLLSDEKGLLRNICEGKIKNGEIKLETYIIGGCNLRLIVETGNEIAMNEIIRISKNQTLNLNNFINDGWILKRLINAGNEEFKQYLYELFTNEENNSLKIENIINYPDDIVEIGRIKNIKIKENLINKIYELCDEKRIEFSRKDVEKELTKNIYTTTTLAGISNGQNYINYML